MQINTTLLDEYLIHEVGYIITTFNIPLLTTILQFCNASVVYSCFSTSKFTISDDWKYRINYSH